MGQEVALLFSAGYPRYMIPTAKVSRQKLTSSIETSRTIRSQKQAFSLSLAVDNATVPPVVARYSYDLGICWDISAVLGRTRLENQVVIGMEWVRKAILEA
tara:strand:+ start:246 stop:548 length:303 start_codon:yes stop_codon:yes gene_type:complete